MSKFEVGDRVKWVRDFTKLKSYTEYIGEEYTIDGIDVEYEYPYHLKEVGRWVPEMAIEKVEEDILNLPKTEKYVAGTWVPLGKEKDWEVSAPAQARLYKDLDRYVITLERFDMDGKKYMSGSADICGPEFYDMWDCYIA